MKVWPIMEKIPSHRIDPFAKETAQFIIEFLNEPERKKDYQGWLQYVKDMILLFALMYINDCDRGRYLELVMSETNRIYKSKWII